jgi:hypothetical protein
VNFRKMFIDRIVRCKFRHPDLGRVSARFSGKVTCTFWANRRVSR